MKKALYSAAALVLVLTLLLCGCARTVDTYDDPTAGSSDRSRLSDDITNDTLMGTENGNSGSQNDLASGSTGSGANGQNGGSGIRGSWNDNNSSDGGSMNGNSNGSTGTRG